MKAIKHYLRFVLPTLLVAAVMMTSCSSGASKEGAFIPKEAYFVATADLGAIWEKGELKKAKDLKTVKSIRNMIKQNSKDLDKIIGSILEDPETSGLDFGKNLTMFAARPDHNTYFVVSATMKDNEKFEAMFSKMKKADLLDYTKKADKKNGLKMMLLDDASIVYNGDRVLMIASDRYERNDDKTDYAVELFSLPSEDAISSLSSFNDFWSERHDAAIFIPYSSTSNMGGMYYSAASNTIFESFLDSDELKQLEESGMYIAVAFEKGSIDVHSGACGVPKKLKKIADASFNSSLLDYMPEKTLAAATLAINTDYIIELMESDKNTKKALKEKIGVKKYTVRDVLESIGGSAVVSFYGFDDNGMPLFAGALDIKNADIAKDLLKESGLRKQDGFYNADGIYIHLDKDVIVISSDNKVVKKAANGGYSNGMKAIASKAKKGNYIYVNLDIDKYPKEIKEQLKYMVDEEVLNFLSTFTHIEMSQDGDEAIVQLFFKDDKTNSLSYLINKSDKLIAAEIEREEARAREFSDYYTEDEYYNNNYDYGWNTDSTVIQAVEEAYDEMYY